MMELMSTQPPISPELSQPQARLKLPAGRRLSIFDQVPADRILAVFEGRKPNCQEPSDVRSR